MMVRLFFALLFSSVTLLAHQTGLSYIHLVQQKDGIVDVTYKKPLSDTRSGDITIHYPDGCLEQTQEATKIVNGFIIKRSELWCQKDALYGEKIWVEGLVRSDRGVLVRYEDGDFVKKEILRATTPYIVINKQQNRFDIAFEYIELGIEHILSGYDHLLFVLLLFLLSANLKSLLYSISAFTLSHSITLTCGILGIIYMPPPFIEAMIALSIIFLAKELFAHEDTFTKRHLGVVAFSFGLLHGFGFSSSLQDIGLPHDEIPLSLFCFNVGIELGQIMFILGLSFVFYMVKYFGIHMQKYYGVLAYIAGTIASFWFIQRVLAF